MPDTNFIRNGDVAPTISYDGINLHFGATVEDAPVTGEPGWIVLAGGRQQAAPDCGPLVAGHAHQFAGAAKDFVGGLLRFRFSMTSSGTGATADFRIGPAGTPGVTPGGELREDGTFGPLTFIASGNEQTLLCTIEAVEGQPAIGAKFGRLKLGE
jgi:hypothetical protein